MGSNPTHCQQLFSVIHCLSLFTRPIRQNEYRLSVAGVIHIELGLKTRMYVLHWLAVVVLGLNTISDKLDTNSTHTGIAYSHLTCTTHLWLHGLCTAHCEKQQKSQCPFGLEHAKFSFHKKWNNCVHPYLTVSIVWNMSDRQRKTELKNYHDFFKSLNRIFLFKSNLFI